MGTRADFYIGRGANAEWLGSIAWDGYPSGIPASLLNAPSEEAFRRELALFAEKREDWTAPEQGWPWPWDNSQTTDYAYAFDGGVRAASGDHGSTLPRVSQRMIAPPKARRSPICRPVRTSPTQASAAVSWSLRRGLAARASRSNRASMIGTGEQDAR